VPLLVNQDHECHPAIIIQNNSNMLFGDDLSLWKKSKYKYIRVELAEEAIKEIPVKGRRSV
jgi:hypothetical protein